MHKPETSTDNTVAIDAIRSRVNTILADWFKEQQAQARPIGTEYAELWQAMLELSQAGGKRIRPYLTILSYQAFGGRDIEALLPVAAAQELLHLSLLVHDDIIDRDDVRYGVANISGAYKKRFAGQTPDADHYALSSALLAGDLLISGSYQLTLRSTLEHSKRIALTELLTTAIFEVGGGEFLDTLASFSPLQSFDSTHVAQYKTASYSFVAPLVIGATAADADEQTKQLLTKLGTSLGIAYQLSDDLLGTFGDSSKTGKSVDGDIRERKRTYLLQQTFELSDATTKAKLDAYLSKPTPSDSDIAFVRDAMIQSGARQHTERLMQDYAEQGKQALHTLALEPHYTAILDGLIDKAVWRTH